MSKIQEIVKSETINQSNNNLKYFKPINAEKKLANYELIIKKISQAQKRVLIASTDGIHNSIIDATYQSISNNANVYIILKSFDKPKLLQKYNQTRPAIIRENKNLQNDFIIADDTELIFFRSLSLDENIMLHTEDDNRSDLYYWFNYYFWNNATLEKILDKIGKPKESPYPPFCSKRENINLYDENDNAINKVVFPANSQNREGTKNYSSVYISPNITHPMLFTAENKSIYGGLLFNQNFFDDVTEKYELCSSTLAEIDTKIIPFDEKDWTKSIKIEEEQKIDLGEVSADLIENMQTTKPEFTESPYVKEIQYVWKVQPPILPRDAKKSKLYQEFANAKNKINNDLIEIRRNLESIVSNTNFFAKLFGGKIRTAKTKLQECDKWEALDLTKISYNELQDILKENGEFENLYNSAVDDSKEFSREIDKAKQKDDWEKRKEGKQKDLTEKKEKLEGIKKEQKKITENLTIADKELKQVATNRAKVETAYNTKKTEIDAIKQKQTKTLDGKVKTSEKKKGLANKAQEFKKNENDNNNPSAEKNKDANEEILQQKMIELGELEKNKKEVESLYNKKQHEIKNLQTEQNTFSKKLSTINAEIDSLNAEIKNKYTTFEYKESKNELDVFQKGNKNYRRFEKFNIPKYLLPEVGTLYETNENYYIEIENYEELEKANEIAKNRYINKLCKVVAKES